MSIQQENTQKWKQEILLREWSGNTVGTDEPDMTN